MRLLELSQKLSQKIRISRRQSGLFLKVLSEELKAGLKEEGRLRLRGFGSFEIRKTSQGWRILFRASRRILERLNR